MKLFKRVFILTILIAAICMLSGCSIGYKNKNLLTLGIKVNVEKGMKFSYSDSTVFNYNNVSIPSITIQGITKQGTVSFKSFPFTIEDYKNHFKSAFSSEKVEKIVYDFKEVKVKKKSNVKSMYKSKAILKDDNKKQYSYIYLLSFKDRSGTLIIECVSNRDDEKTKMIKSIETISSNIENIECKGNSNSSEMNEVKVVEDYSVLMPKHYTIKKSGNSNVYYVNGFGNNEAMYVVTSKKKPKSTSSLSWNNINGYEVLKQINDNRYLVHDINTQGLYYLDTEIKEIKTITGQKYYSRVETLKPIKNVA